MLSNRKGESDNDDDGDDNDVDDIDYDGDGSHSEDTDSDNRDVSKVESLSDRKQATAKTTTCYTPKSVSAGCANRDACASVSTTTRRSKRIAVDCASKKNEAVSTTSRVTQSNLSPSKSDSENRSTNNSALSSLAGNLPKCQVKIKKLRAFEYPA